MLEGLASAGMGCNAVSLTLCILAFWVACHWSSPILHPLRQSSQLKLTPFIISFSASLDRIAR